MLSFLSAAGMELNHRFLRGIQIRKVGAGSRNELAEQDSAVHRGQVVETGEAAS